MMNSFTRFAVSGILKEPFKVAFNLSVGLIVSSTVLGSWMAIANAQSAQITLSIDASLSPTFSDLIKQAESRAETEISQRFQADPTLNELQIMISGERNGQLVSLLSTRVSREAWQANSDIRQWTRYFATSSTLLGYRNPDAIAIQQPVMISRVPSSTSSLSTPIEYIPSERIEADRESGRISESEYWRLLDERD